MVSQPTKKIKIVLEKHKITNVVNGYFSKMPSDDLKERAAGICYTTYTCWDKQGQVVCLLIKPHRSEWQLANCNKIGIKCPIFTEE